MNGISPKVANAGTGGSIAGMAATLLIWALSHWVTVPPEIASVIVSLVTSLSALGAGYWSAHDPYVAGLIQADQAAHNPPNPPPPPPGG